MPIRIDFYLLSSPSMPASQDFICRLVEKAFKQSNRLYINVDNHAEAKQLNDLLWTYNDISFIPHAIYDAAAPCANIPPILIGCDPAPKNCGEVLLNLTMGTAEFFSQFQRIIEIVPQNTDWQQSGREHYKYYRSLGYELFTHDLKKS